VGLERPDIQAKAGGTPLIAQTLAAKRRLRTMYYRWRAAVIYLLPLIATRPTEQANVTGAKI